MKYDRNYKRDPQSYWQCQEFLFREANHSFAVIDRRVGADRRTNSKKADGYAKTARRRMPDRRISNIEVDWIAEGSEIL